MRASETFVPPVNRELLRRYQVMAPMRLLSGRDGIERRSQRIIGEVNASQFLRKWNETMAGG